MKQDMCPEDIRKWLCDTKYNKHMFVVDTVVYQQTRIIQGTRGDNTGGQYFKIMTNGLFEIGDYTILSPFKTNCTTVASKKYMWQKSAIRAGKKAGLICLNTFEMMLGMYH